MKLSMRSKRSTHSAIWRKYRNIKVLVSNNKGPSRPNAAVVSGAKGPSQGEL